MRYVANIIVEKLFLRNSKLLNNLFFSSADELVLTEMIFNGVFNDLTVEQCPALLSCFVFQEKVQFINIYFCVILHVRGYFQADKYRETS